MIPPRSPEAKADALPPQPDGGLRHALPTTLIWSIAGLVLAYSLSLYSLLRFALSSELYSYILLIPFVSAYLFCTAPKTTASLTQGYRALATVFFAIGVTVLGGYWATKFSGTALVTQDALALSILSFVFFLTALCALFLDRSTFRTAIFPLTFLLFCVPFPVSLEHVIEMALQHGSAPPAFWLFTLAGTPVHKVNLVFDLPGMTLQIAPECSGIRSTLVLFLTSLVAGHLFLRSPWRRSILAAAVIPLALLRNGFRVFVIGELCVHIGPHMIDSVVHHRGGPIFFLLSLIPFSVLVYFLFRGDRPIRTALQSVAS